MTLAFSDESDEEIARIMKRYPTRLAALIPTLWVAQHEFGTVTREVMELVATRLDLPTAKVITTATFYTMFNKKPVGRFHVQVCKNISCYLRRSDDVTAALKDAIGVGPGETTADGLFTLSEVECLAACGRAPAVQVNKTYHEWATPEGMRQLVADLRASVNAAPMPPPEAHDG